MKIDTDAFLDSFPIMGNGLLGIFIVTVVIILGIYLLRALTSRKAEPVKPDAAAEAKEEPGVTGAVKKESAMDLMKEREKKDFLETEDTYNISNDL